MLFCQQKIDQRSIQPKPHSCSVFITTHVAFLFTVLPPSALISVAISTAAIRLAGYQTRRFYKFNLVYYRILYLSISVAIPLTLPIPLALAVSVPVSIVVIIVIPVPMFFVLTTVIALVMGFRLRTRDFP